MKLVNIPRYIDNDVINYIDELTKRVSASDFDENSFLNWLVEYDIGNKTNPSAYVKSCFKKELDNGTFRPKPQVLFIPNTQVLINEMRDRDIVLLADDIVWLNVFWNYILNIKKVDSETCRVLNKQILDYMKTHDFREYKDLLMKSKSMKQYKVEWKVVDNQTQLEIKKWNEILDDIGEVESEE